MTIYCLICDSTAVLPKDATTSIVILVGTMENFFNGMKEVQPAPTEDPAKNVFRQLLCLISKGVSRATSGYIATLAFAQDVQKYQFSHYDYLCLRCGAQFNQSAYTETASPTAVIPSLAAQPSAQSAPPPSTDPRDPAAPATD